MMDLSDIIPKNGDIRRIYCDVCEASMDLIFPNFSEIVSEIEINITGLPHLQCPECNQFYLTDGARFAIMELHRQAIEKNSARIDVTRKKRDADYTFSKIPFLVDADDYYYIPGLRRPFDEGFLTPLFFNRAVLIKFDNSPDYKVQFASQSYGTIYTDERSFSFGVNRHGKIIMWLGDVATLPESEQYYLRSENVTSDHSIGSEFYDGQIECKFTDLTKEAEAIKIRSTFDKAFENRFGANLYHLSDELIETITNLSPPLVDTEKERRHVFDSLNRTFVESMDNGALDKLIKENGVIATGTGSLKRIQALLEKSGNPTTISAALMPFYVLYDLRIAYSHLTSAARRDELVSSSEQRLKLRQDATLTEIYDSLLDQLCLSFAGLTKKL
jgi:hypothetical protein